jgi:hypothetical protein
VGILILTGCRVSSTHFYFFGYIATSQLFSDYSMSAQSSPITSMEEVGPLQHREETIPNLGMKMPMPVHYVLGRPMHSRHDDDDDDDEYAETTASSDSLFDLSEINREGRHSPPPSNDIQAEARNERRYRLLLEHQFHPSRKFNNGVSLVN